MHLKKKKVKSKAVLNTLPTLKTLRFQSTPTNRFHISLASEDFTCEGFIKWYERQNCQPDFSGTENINHQMLGPILLVCTSVLPKTICHWLAGLAFGGLLPRLVPASMIQKHQLDPRMPPWFGAPWHQSALRIIICAEGFVVVIDSAAAITPSTKMGRRVTEL